MKRKRGLIFIGIGFELVGLILGALFVGSIVETKFPLDGIWYAIFIMLGLIIWLIHIVMLVKIMEKHEKNE